MIRYRYAQHLNPPAPFVNVALLCPQTGNRAANLPAKSTPPRIEPCCPARSSERSVWLKTVGCCSRTSPAMLSNCRFSLSRSKFTTERR